MTVVVINVYRVFVTAVRVVVTVEVVVTTGS